MNDIKEIRKEIEALEYGKRQVKTLCKDTVSGNNDEADAKLKNLKALRAELQQDKIDNDAALLKAKNNLDVVTSRYGFIVSKRRGVAVELEKTKKERGKELLYGRSIDALNEKITKLETNLAGFDDAMSGYEGEKFTCEQNIIRTRTAAERKVYHG